MNTLDSRLFRTANIIVDFFLLNLLWVIASIPVITFFPATAAMFGVVRKWILKKETKGVLLTFTSLFKEAIFKQFHVAIVWYIAAFIIYLDFNLIEHMANPTLFFVVILYAGGFLFAITSLYLFPVIVHYDLRLRHMWKNSLYLAIIHPRITITLLLIAGLGVMCFYLLPISILFLGSFFALLIYYTCQIAFNRIEILRS
ncbi:DUF624 domain-containing protein [Mesobacillus subterraneus]|uniref:YesL family protein n=1 Tax=Mesobacillus subterraneus TaxID=285983 RepID=UPI00203DE32F|nr:DUF624 domain-containing protein [Mesobacillus subterraneus]MCM3575592.1 DUF624 domain-containing protein [Mesobacillus subterraneus]